MPVSSVHSDWRKGALVMWDTHRKRIVDAFGANVFKFLDDFTAVPVDDTTGNPTEWTLTLVEAGAGESTLTQIDAAGGQLRIAADANDNDGVNAQLNGESFGLLASGRILYFGAFGVKLSEATQSDLFLGLAVTDTDILGGVTDRIGFEKLDGSTALKFMLEKDSTETLSASVLTVADGVAFDIEFYLDETGVVEFFVNGASAGKPAVTNLPNDELLRVSWQFLSGAAGAGKTCDVDAIRVVQIGR